MTTGSHFFKLYFLPLSNCRQREDSRQILLSWTLPGQLAQTLVNLNLASQTIYSKIKFNPNYIRGPTCCWFIAYYNTTKLINCRDVGMGVEYIFQFFSSKFLQAFNVIWNTEKEKNNKKKKRTCTFKEWNPFLFTKSGSFSVGARILINVPSIQPSVFGNPV